MLWIRSSLALFEPPMQFKSIDFDMIAAGKKEIYHYTNLGGLLGIIESGGFWLSDCRFLNDSQEYENGVLLCKRIMKDAAESSKYGDFASVLSLIASEFDTMKRHPYYVCSFSLANDSLEQWRAYANNNDGVQIKFETSEPFVSSHFCLPPVMSSQTVIYEDAKKEAIFWDYIEIFHQEYVIDVQKGRKIDVSDWAEYMASRLSTYFILFKHHSFAAEQEIRIVTNEHHIKDFEGIKHRARNGLIIP